MMMMIIMGWLVAGGALWVFDGDGENDDDDDADCCVGGDGDDTVVV